MYIYIYQNIYMCKIYNTYFEIFDVALANLKVNKSSENPVVERNEFFQLRIQRLNFFGLFKGNTYEIYRWIHPHNLRPRTWMKCP